MLTCLMMMDRVTCLRVDCTTEDGNDCSRRHPPLGFLFTIVIILVYGGACFLPLVF